MKVRLPAGVATSIGSLPHTDAVAAASFVCAVHPRLPAAPQLPACDPREAMVPQWLVGVPGVAVAPDGTIGLDPRRLDPDAAVDTGFDGPAFGGLRAFLDAVRARRRPVKVQLTGPVTLGLALVQAGAPAARAFAVAAAVVRARGRALLELVRDRAPEADPVVFLDEPGLTAAVHPGFPLDRESLVDLVSTALAALEPAAAGVHCCGPTDLRIPVAAGARILSFPATPACASDAGVIAGFLESGGWVAWGAVPTSGPVGSDPEPLWRRLSTLWCELARGGCDPVLLRAQALITPACGLARHTPAQAEMVLRHANAIAEHVHDQALAARLSVGA